MPVSQETYGLVTSIAVAKDFIGTGVPSNKHDEFIQALILQVEDDVESICNRKFKSRTYTRDGSAPAKSYLDGTGGPTIWLPNPPITAITSIKRRFTDSSTLTEGADNDFTFDPWSGAVTLNRAIYDWRAGRNYVSTVQWPAEKKVIPVTYTGGFLTLKSGDVGYDSDADAEFGWHTVARQVELAVLLQVKLLYKRFTSKSQDVASYSTTGGTFNFRSEPFSPEAMKILQRFKIPRLH